MATARVVVESPRGWIRVLQVKRAVKDGGGGF
jgi:hypothetical protein